MGVGKSTVGAVLARKLRWPFIDLDTTIEAGQGTTIRQMFEQAGEAFFREIERAALIEASKAEPAIIALGGGTFVQPLNFEHIQETGSIAKAARCMGMSYNRAWLLVRTMNGCFQEPVVSAERGGSARGGAQLTRTGQEVLALYHQLEAETLKATRQTCRRIQAFLKP